MPSNARVCIGSDSRYGPGMSTPQGGIFALGTSSHAYLEFDALAGQRGRALVDAISALREPWTTMGGVNLVAGFRPELWREVAPDDAPPTSRGSTRTSSVSMAS